MRQARLPSLPMSSSPASRPSVPGSRSRTRADQLARAQAAETDGNGAGTADGGPGERLEAGTAVFARLATGHWRVGRVKTDLGGLSSAVDVEYRDAAGKLASVQCLRAHLRPHDAGCNLAALTDLATLRYGHEQLVAHALARAAGDRDEGRLLACGSRTVVAVGRRALASGLPLRGETLAAGKRRALVFWGDSPTRDAYETGWIALPAMAAFAPQLRAARRVLRMLTGRTAALAMRVHVDGTQAVRAVDMDVIATARFAQAAHRLPVVAAMRQAARTYADFASTYHMAPREADDADETETASVGDFCDALNAVHVSVGEQKDVMHVLAAMHALADGSESPPAALATASRLLDLGSALEGGDADECAHLADHLYARLVAWATQRCNAALDMVEEADAPACDSAPGSLVVLELMAPGEGSAAAASHEFIQSIALRREADAIRRALVDDGVAGAHEMVDRAWRATPAVATNAAAVAHWASAADRKSVV